MESFPYSRRKFLQAGMAAACAPAAFLHAEENSQKQSSTGTFRVHQWNRDSRNPIFPPRETFDERRCMNPFVVRHDDQYMLFYSGAEKSGRQRICLAQAPMDRLDEWTRLGPIVDVGGPGAFDENWCVLPCVHRFGNRWHLYYTGNGKVGKGLQSFRGIGLAVSDDLLTWKKWSEEPVLRGNGFERWPENHGIAGGGSLIEIPQSDGHTVYRMYYTLAVGHPDKSLLVDQAKYSVVADSRDGIDWGDRRVVLEPRQDAEYENAATIGLTVWKEGEHWRALYAGIGTQFGAYSICEAESTDGLNWFRGKPGENLALPPQGTGWESKMTTYPHLVEEPDQLRLFYCGNGYGRTGIGMATATRLRSITRSSVEACPFRRACLPAGDRIEDSGNILHRLRRYPLHT